MENNKVDAVRIQTSVLNALEKKVLVWLAVRMGVPLDKLENSKTKPPR